MTPRPCTWPDGGCGEPVIFVPSAKTAKKMVLDAKPEKRVILDDDLTGSELVLHSAMVEGAADDPDYRVARVVDTYVDHHATCRAWLARVERQRRERAATQATKAGRL